MNFEDITVIAEGYNYIQNGMDIKVKKDECEYYHYTTPEKFVKIVRDGALKGSYYPGNTYTYGKDGKKGDEICLVRSDRNPELNKMSVSFGANDNNAIKFTFKRDTIEKVFGKIKPINEYPVAAIKQMNNDLQRAKKKFANNQNIMKLLNDAENNWKKWDWDTAKQKEKELEKLTDETFDFAYYGNDYQNSGEKMESRIRLGNKTLPLKYVEHIYIPNALQYNPDVSESIEMLKRKGFNNFSFIMPRKNLKNIDKSRIQYKE